MAIKCNFCRKVAISLVAMIFKVLTATLYKTYRVQSKGYDVLFQRVADNQPFIFSFWHYSFAYFSMWTGGVPGVVMVSASNDGEFLAKILENKGYETVRGSRHRGGLGALKGLLKAVKKGRCPIIVADGSKGPARVVQAGAILLASRSGAPILPVCWSAKRYWVFNSWDRTAIPQPFSKVWELCAEPFYVPKGLDSEGLEEYRQRLEVVLNSLYDQAWARFDRLEH